MGFVLPPHVDQTLREFYEHDLNPDLFDGVLPIFSLEHICDATTYITFDRNDSTFAANVICIDRLRDASRPTDVLFIDQGAAFGVRYDGSNLHIMRYSPIPTEDGAPFFINEEVFAHNTVYRVLDE